MDYKNEEKRHYNNKYGISSRSKNSISDLVMHHAHNYFEQEVNKALANNKTNLILDFGCGTGAKSVKFSSLSNKIIGIDISETSIEIANKVKNTNSKFIVMDCEKLNFPPNYFDIIFDYGTFSSIEINSAIVEIIKVMKPDASLIAIETYGHNPISNIKRRINVLLGKRTKWAASHIMKKKHWDNIISNFNNYKITYFGSISLFFVPILKISPKNFQEKILSFVNKIDFYLSNKNILKYLAFKTVVVLSNPQKK